MSNLTNNTSELRNVLAAVNALPPASGGGITPSGTLTIEKNGDGINVTNYAAVNVRVPSDEPNIQPLTVRENGTYTPSGDVDGYGPVTVDVETSGGDTDVEDALIQHENLTQYTNNRVTYVGYGAFFGISSLTKLHLPNVTTVGAYGIYQCTNLSDLDLSSAKTLESYALARSGKFSVLHLPELTSAGQHCLAYLTYIIEVILPKLTTMAASAFRFSYSLEKIDIGGRLTEVPNNAFNDCENLVSLILRSDAMVPLASTTALTGTPIASGTGYVYVPAALVDSYKAATNWSKFASQFRAIEDYPDITGG